MKYISDNMCRKFIKAGMAAVSVINMLAGAGIIILSTISFAYLHSDHGIMAPLLGLFVGLLLLCLGIIGISAAYDEKKRTLRTFFILQMLTFIVFGNIFILMYAFSGNIEEMAKFHLYYALNMYNNDSAVRTDVDWMQSWFECCGVSNYSDWQNTSWYSSQNITNHLYPQSCCSHSSCNYSSPAKDTQLFKQGCFPVLQMTFETVFVIVAADFLALLVLGMVFAAILLFIKSSHLQEIPYFGIIDDNLDT